MKIYTYYQDISHSSQSKLIDLWKISWTRRGYEPVVLNLEDAKKNPYFETLNMEMRRIFKEITNKQISDYGMSCWFRWLAYATQQEEKFYVSDYDAININFPTTEPNDKLHLMDFDCPFLASGTPSQFDKLCNSFVDISQTRMSVLKKHVNHYHDQEFFHYNFMVPRISKPDYDQYTNKYNILLTRDRRKIGGSYDPVKNMVHAGPNIGYIENDKYGVAHISHYNIIDIQNKYSKYRKRDSNLLRIYLIEKLLETT